MYGVIRSMAALVRWRKSILRFPFLVKCLKFPLFKTKQKCTDLATSVQLSSCDVNKALEFRLYA